MHNAVVTLDSQISARLKRNADGLVCAVVQQHDSREVLMVGWMDDEALRRTLEEGRVTFWSRSRREYWRKGDTSGHAQYVKSVHLDCDGDALLIEVDQVGAACHTGERTCFLAGGDLGAHVGARPSGPLRGQYGLAICNRRPRAVTMDTNRRPSGAPAGEIGEVRDDLVRGDGD